MTSVIRAAVFYIRFLVAAMMIVAVPGALWADTSTLNFTTSGDYTFDSSKVEVSGGVAKLIEIDQTDDDNDATGGFGGTTHTSTQYDAGNGWLELNTTTNTFKLPDNADSSGWVDMSDNILLLHMDEASWTGAANEIIDSSGQGNHGNRSGNPTTTAADGGKVDRSGEFDRVGDNVSVGNLSDLANATNVTWMTWVKLDSAGISSNDDQDIFAKGSHGTGIPFLIWRDDSVSASSDQSGNVNCFSVFVEDGSDATWISTPNGTANSTSWMHLAITFEALHATGLKFYINGELQVSGNTTAVDYLLTNGNIVSIGADATANTEFDGSLDEVAIWTRTLDADEIKRVYDMQVRSYSGFADSRVMDATTAVSWSSINYTNPYPTGKELPDNGATETGYTSGNIDMSNNELLLHLNETALDTAPGGTDVEDFSGNGNHGTESGTVAGNQISPLNTGFDFDGTDEYIDVGNDASLQITDNLTVMMWMKGPAGQDGVNMAAKYDTGTTQRSWYLGTSVSGSDGAANRLRVVVSDDGTYNAGQIKAYASTDTILDSSWHHVAFTFSGGTLKLYVDGVEDTTPIQTEDDPITTLHNSTAVMTIGSRVTNGAASNFFEGQIDEVAVFSEALSAADIASIYRRGNTRLLFQVRSDDDNSNWGPYVGPDGTRNTFFTELNNNTGSTPSFNLSGVSNNRYFQYRTYMTALDTSVSPELQSFSVTPTHYPADSPTIVNQTGISYTTLQAFSATAGASNAGTLTYQLSPDGTTYYYHNGTSWTTAASTANANTASDVDSNISSFPSDVSTGSLRVRAVLTSSSTQEVELDNIDIVHNVTISLDNANLTLDEDAGTATVTLTRSQGINYTSTVNYAVTNSTATANTDYTFSSGTATFAAGATTASFTFTVIDDTSDEPSEFAVITLSNPTRAALGTNSAITINITDNDETPAGSAVAEVDDPLGQAPHATTFTVDGVTDSAIAYLWDYDNDGTPDEVTTTGTSQHTYLEAGDYTIGITIVLEDGTTQTVSQAVSVSAAANVPTARITLIFADNNNDTYDSGTDSDLDSDATNLEGSVITVSPGQRIGFKGEATATNNIITWQWDFNGDGTVNHQTSNGTDSYGFYTFNTPGTYLAKLTTVEDDGAGTAQGADSTTVTIRVTEPTSATPKLWIAQPTTNQSVSGDALSIQVKFSPASAFDMSTADIEINNGSGWQSTDTLGSLTSVNTMSDSVLLALDTTQLTNGSYSVRASADTTGGVSVSSGASDGQQAITLTVVDTGADIDESSDSQSIVITPTTESDMHQGEDTLIGVSLGTVSADRTLSVTRFTTDPVRDTVTADNQTLAFVNEWREIKLLDGSTETQPEKPVTVRIYYDDDNDDGIVDGTSTAEGALSIYRYTNGSWMELLNVTRNATDNYIEGQTPGFSFFSVATSSSTSSASGGTAGIASGLTSGGGGGGGCLYRTLR